MAEDLKLEEQSNVFCSWNQLCGPQTVDCGFYEFGFAAVLQRFSQSLSLQTSYRIPFQKLSVYAASFMYHHGRDRSISCFRTQEWRWVSFCKNPSNGMFNGLMRSLFTTGLVHATCLWQKACFLKLEGNGAFWGAREGCICMREVSMKRFLFHSAFHQWTYPKH